VQNLFDKYYYLPLRFSGALCLGRHGLQQRGPSARMGVERRQEILIAFPVMRGKGSL
jgi:hypothetical protein